MVKQLSLDNDVPKRSHIDPILRKYIWVDSQNKKYIKEKNQFKQVTKYKGQYIIKKQKGRSAIVKGGYPSQKGGELYNTCNTPLMDGTYFYNTELNYDTNKKYNVDIKYNTNTDETNRDHKITDECDKYYSEFLYDYYLVVEFRIVILRNANNEYTTYTFTQDFDTEKHANFLNLLTRGNKYLELFIYNSDNKYRYFIIFEALLDTLVTDKLNEAGITNTADYKKSVVDVDMVKFEKTMDVIVGEITETLSAERVKTLLTEKIQNLSDLIQINNQHVVNHDVSKTFVTGLQKMYNDTIDKFNSYGIDNTYNKYNIETIDNDDIVAIAYDDSLQNSNTINPHTVIATPVVSALTKQKILPATITNGSRIEIKRGAASVGGGGYRQIPKNKKSVLNKFLKSLMLIANANNKKRAAKAAKAAPRNKKVAKKVRAK
jgi:hypothetical protein